MWLCQCYDTDSYNAPRRSMVFHLVRSVTLGRHLTQPEVMVGCRSVRRLFLLECIPSQRSVIHRIDPFNGNVDLDWMVDQNSVALSVAGHDELLLTTRDRIKQYNTEGNLLRQIVTTLEPYQQLQDSWMLPDSMTIHCSFA